jgi:hypothetical protein
MPEGPLFNGILSLAKSDGAMDDNTSLYISPYLLRPIRKLEEVLAQREEQQLRRTLPPPVTSTGRFVVILGGKR